MAYVTLTNITVLDNPTAFTNPFQFEVTFECAQQLEADLEWKITYVGSAEDESRDQVLEEVLVGPVPVGTNKFVFQSDPPNPDIIPDDDKIGVTVVLVTCSYRSKEFVRVGYYVNNDYADPFLLENPPPSVDITKLQRNILADKPRVTRFPIDWSPGGTQQMTDGNPVGMFDGNGQQNGDMDMNMVDDDELVKAAAQLDHTYRDIVIDGQTLLSSQQQQNIAMSFGMGGQPEVANSNMLDENDDEEEEEEDDDDQDEDGDMEMDDVNQEIDLESEEDL